MNTLSLYVFYEKNGKLRDYEKYYLQKLRLVSKICIIVNGNINSCSLEYIKKSGFDYFLRENFGFDFGAWKDWLAKYYYPDLRNLDQLVLCNCSCYGPFFPFEEVFKKMKSIDCDFWGLYRHPALHKVCPAHLQSYFIVLKSNLINSKTFKTYFSKLSYAKNWREAVKQEVNFTNFFEDHGFKSASLINREILEICPDPSIVLPEKLVSLGFPLVKRKAFTADYKIHQLFSDASHARKVLNYLKTFTDYPVDLIYKDLLENLPNSKIRNILHLNYVLDSAKSKDSLTSNRSKTSVAVVLYSYYEDLIAYDLSYLSHLPESACIFVCVTTEKLKESWSAKLAELQYKFEVRIQRNRGRNEAAYWVTCKDVIQHFDYICLLHDKKTPTAKPAVKGISFNEHCWNSALYSMGYVENIVRLFDSHPKLGLLMPTVPMFAEWPDLILGREWAGDREVALRVYRQLGLTVPFDEHPVTPWGAMFWIRGKAMSAFYRYPWSVDDFPPEPLAKADGTVLHALERMYPMIVQEAGYLSAWVIPSELAGNYYDNSYEKLLEYKQFFDYFVLHDNHFAEEFQKVPDFVLTNLHFSLIKRGILLYLKKKFIKFKNKF